MSAVEILPPIPQPPHDPKFTLLSERTGWREAKRDKTTVIAVAGVSLERLPGTGRTYSEPSGSLGGLVPPANVSVGSGGEILLLDPASKQLKRFDPCDCRFVTVGCFIGGPVRREPGDPCRPPASTPGPHIPANRLVDPRAIAVCAGNLFITDSGTRRVLVFSLHGLVPRDIWTSPARANLANPWRPYGIAIDQRGRVFISDPDNGGIHRLSSNGRWETFFGGLGVVQHLAVDCEGRLFVVRELEPGAMILDGDGTNLGSSDGPAAESLHFAALPFPIDRDGNMELGHLCSPPGSHRFSLNGNELSPAQATPVVTFEARGTFVSGPLDSQVYRCVWHRVILRGTVPKAARIRVSTFTSEAVLPREHLDLPGVVWATNPAVMRAVDKDWDCLIPSPPGRYLWLRLELFSDGYMTPVIEEVRLEFPRISLRRYLPAVFGDEPVSSNFTDRFLSIFDTTLRSIEHEVDLGAALYDPMSAPAKVDRQTGTDALSWLASWIGVRLERHWPEAMRREWLKRAGNFLCTRGTPEGLRSQLALLLGMEQARNCCPQEYVCRKHCQPVLNCAEPVCRPAWDTPPLILEHFKIRRWLYVGSGRIGDQAELWGRSIVNRSQLGNGAQAGVSKLAVSQDPLRDPFHVTAHRYSVFVPAAWGKSDAHRRSLLNLLRSETPGYTQGQIEYVEPRFRIGIQSTVGLNSVVGRYPSGVTLDKSALGGASVLSSPPGQSPGPSAEIGRRTRIGGTTLLS